MHVRDVIEDRKMIFKVAGIYPEECQNRPYFTWFKMYFVISAYVVFITLQIVGLCTVASSDEKPEYILDVVGYVAGVTKCATLTFKRNKILKLLTQTTNFESSSKSTEELKITKFWKSCRDFIVKCIVRSYVVSVLSYFVVVIFEAEKSFPAKLMFKTNTIFSPWYEIIYVIELMMFIIMSFSMSSSDMISVIFICQLCKELRVIKMMLENAIEGDHKTLVRILKRHVMVLRFGDDVRDVLSSSFFSQSCLISLLMCFSSILTLTVSNQVTRNKMMWLIVLTMSMLFVICMAGELIANASSDIANALTLSNLGSYNSGIHSIKDLKSISFALVRAQKPLQITMGTLGTVNIRFFCSTMKNVYSITMLLRTVIRKF